MRRINILYLSLPVLVYALLAIYRHLNRSTASFYGVAENQETQINLEHDATVNRILVAPGQFVTKGTLLLEVTRNDLDFKMSGLTYSIAELQARDQLRIAETKSDLQRVQAERAEKIADIQAHIRLLESEQALNQRLVRDLKSVRTPDTLAIAASPYATRLQALRDELRTAIEPLDVEISRLETELRNAGAPAKTQISKLQKDIDLYQREQERLKIYAPADGLVGELHCQPGENVAAFSPYISFYEQNPNRVIAYVHESLILSVNVGDSLTVISSLHPEEQCLGRVSGLGHRVVEIPERLRKIPEIKTYGREILIAIPSDNRFLQKEKVILQRLNPPAGTLLSLFQRPAPGNL